MNKEDGLGHDDIYTQEDWELYLGPTYFVNADHPDILEYTSRVIAGMVDPIEKAVALVHAVRDDFRYDPYGIDLRPSALRAVNILKREPRYGYCTEKAVVLASCARAAGIPARFRFGNVRNHIGVEKLTRIMRTNLMVFHGYNELYLDGRWVKCTVAFNKALCDKLGVATLDFDGVNHSIFQPFSKDGSEFMYYEHDYGSFHDVPMDMFISELKRFYPHLFGNEQDLVFIKDE